MCVKFCYLTTKFMKIFAIVFIYSFYEPIAKIYEIAT